MAIEKMQLMKISGKADDLNEVLKVLYCANNFHIESTDAISVGTQVGAIKEKNPYTELLDKLNTVLVGLKYTPKKSENETDLTLSEASEYLQKLSDDTSELVNLRNELKTEVEDYTQTLTQINRFVGMESNIEELFSDGEIKIRIGKLPIDSFPKLRYYASDDLLYEILDKDSEYYWCIYFAPSAREADIDSIFESLYFERIDLPKYLFGSADKAVNGLKTLIETTTEERDKIKEKLDSVKSESKKTLDEIYTKFSFENEIFGYRKNAVAYNDRFYLFGYVPKRQEKELIEKVIKVGGASCEEAEDKDTDDLIPPTKLKNNFLIRPFETIVKMYGIPRYGDLDPTPYVAIVYTLLFGIMFGDLGQGLVIALIGFIMSKFKGMEFGKVLTRIGLSSAVFGFFYGSVFGFEDLLDPIFINVFGMQGKPIDVFEQSGMLLVAAIVMGAVLIAVSIFLNIILGFKRKNYEDAIFGQNGIAGLTFYLSLLIGLGLRFMFDTNVLNPAYIMFLMIIPLVLVFFKKPLGNLISKKKSGEKIKVGEFIAENFFEMFEYILSYATNTMSFLRVGGFILSHAGMMMVVMTLSKMVSGAASPIIVIVGNIFVMGLEGLIVGIQALRLQFYEIFGRFFDGTGIEYKPIGTKENK